VPRLCATTSLEGPPHQLDPNTPPPPCVQHHRVATNPSLGLCAPIIITSVLAKEEEEGNVQLKCSSIFGLKKTMKL